MSYDVARFLPYLVLAVNVSALSEVSGSRGLERSAHCSLGPFLWLVCVFWVVAVGGCLNVVSSEVRVCSVGGFQCALHSGARLLVRSGCAV